LKEEAGDIANTLCTQTKNIPLPGSKESWAGYS